MVTEESFSFTQEEVPRDKTRVFVLYLFLAGKRETDAFGVRTAFLLILFLSVRMMKVYISDKNSWRLLHQRTHLLKSEYANVINHPDFH